MIESEDKLTVLWTSGDKEVALNMVFMYVYNSRVNDWWKEVTFIIWGPSAKLLAEDQELKQEIRSFKDEGIKLEACKACADRYGVTDDLDRLGVDVKYMGEQLTQYIKQGTNIITI